MQHHTCMCKWVLVDTCVSLGIAFVLECLIKANCHMVSSALLSFLLCVLFTRLCLWRGGGEERERGLEIGRLGSVHVGRHFCVLIFVFGNIQGVFKPSTTLPGQLKVCSSVNVQPQFYSLGRRLRKELISLLLDYITHIAPFDYGVLKLLAHWSFSPSEPSGCVATVAEFCCVDQTKNCSQGWCPSCCSYVGLELIVCLFLQCSYFHCFIPNLIVYPPFQCSTPTLSWC